MEGLTEQEANRKDMTLKYPGATTDLIATKNLFDIYLKTKVLNICGDVREEHNENVYGKKWFLGKDIVLNDSNLLITW